MKQLFTMLALFVATISFSQTSDTTNTPLVGYISAGLSMSNTTDFRTSSYTGVETGIMYGNLGAGVVFGRGSLSGLGRSTDNIGQYFYEVKTSASVPIGNLTGTAIFGYGGYFNSARNFIEYGVGMSYSFDHFGYGVTVSNWDGITYITPCVSYCF